MLLQKIRSFSSSGKKIVSGHTHFIVAQTFQKHNHKWVEYAKERNIGIDFNPTFFYHEKAAKLTLSSPDEEIRRFWIRHGQACIRISRYFAEELGQSCVMNIWIPDGYKDILADRLGPRARFKDSLDQILSIPYDRFKVYVCLEFKVFGIGLESYTFGSSEFCLNYAAKNGIISLMDNGYYHPAEVVSDKLQTITPEDFRALAKDFKVTLPERFLCQLPTT